MTHAEHLDPNNAFAQLGTIKLSVTLLHGSDAFTGDLALNLDERQYELGHGPCLHAASKTVNVSVPDMSTEERWPAWARTAQQAGAHSSLSIALPVHERVTGALNIYATTPRAFDTDSTSLAETFAGYAAVALANVHLYETQSQHAAHMQKAMERRAAIEQAKGIIMAEHRCTPDQAFAILTKLSQDTNRKVRDVAGATGSTRVPATGQTVRSDA